MLSYAYWVKNFGRDPKILGRTFVMNDRVHTVVGVLPPLPEYPDANDVYMPTTSCPFRSNPTMIADRDSRMFTVFARMKPEVTEAQDGVTWPRSRIDSRSSIQNSIPSPRESQRR